MLVLDFFFSSKKGTGAGFDDLIQNFGGETACVGKTSTYSLSTPPCFQCFQHAQVAAVRGSKAPDLKFEIYVEDLEARTRTCVCDTTRVANVLLICCETSVNFVLILINCSTEMDYSSKISMFQI